METTKKTFDPKKIEEQRFEFILYTRGHIVCQRYFNIRDYNEDVLKSYELKELLDSIASLGDEFGRMGIIPKFLKTKAEDLLWSMHNPFSQPYEQPLKNNFEKIEDFEFEIKVDKVSVAKSVFSGNYFPPKVRYSIDIREIIPSIMAEIREYFSRKNYTKVCS